PGEYSVTGMLPLSEELLLVWVIGKIYGLWSIPNEDWVARLSHREVVGSQPDWLAAAYQNDYVDRKVYTELRRDEMVSWHDGKTAGLSQFHRGVVALWHGTGACYVHHLLEDGRMIIHVEGEGPRVLKLYRGSRRIGLKEA